MISKPQWFSDDTVMVSTAPTCGLTKGGRLLPVIDPETGKRRQVKDPETQELVDAVDDKLLEDATALAQGKKTDTLTFIPRADVSLRCAVPVYYDRRFGKNFRMAMKSPNFKGFSCETLATLVEKGVITVRNGHGSPSQDQRIGEVPYIKVSDLRAGLVNINPTNRVPVAVARQFWKSSSSGLRAFDLVCPERTSKNIGDFCILLPGQEQVVMTKEVIVLRPGPAANFDAFYLLWALTLKMVRDQWRRVVFMQTNREDVGSRYLEIELPLPPSAKAATQVSAAFRNYYQSIASARENLIKSSTSGLIIISSYRAQKRRPQKSQPNDFVGRLFADQASGSGGRGTWRVENLVELATRSFANRGLATTFFRDMLGRYRAGRAVPGNATATASAPSPRLPFAVPRRDGATSYQSRYAYDRPFSLRSSLGQRASERPVPGARE